jgi:hypothetical protein
MTVDNEKQREILLNCINSCQLSGMFTQLIPVLQEISDVIESVKSAPIANTVIESKESESSLRIVSVE